MRALVSSAFAMPVTGAPKEIVYLPEGTHEIYATIEGKPGKTVVKIPPEKGEAIAAMFQKSLAERHKSNVRPWLDFEHKRGVASGIPQSFRYGELQTPDGPKRGVILALEWSASGKSAIEGKDFSYFSPEFYQGDDGIPDGIPSRGPLGALVNEPAFREIPRIAASDAAPNTENTPIMSKLIFAALAISAAHADAETLAVQAIDALKVQAADAERLKKENDNLKSKVEAAEAKQKDVARQEGEKIFQDLVACSLAPAKDDALKGKIIEAAESGNEFALEAFRARIEDAKKSGNTPLTTPLVTGTDGKAVQASNIEGRAKALITAGEAKDMDEAIDLVCASDPTAYAEYMKTLG